MNRKQKRERKGRTNPAFERTIRERPRDASPRLIYADWLEEQGENGAAELQRIKAKQCTRFDPDFDYAACLKKLAVTNKIRVELIAFGEIICFASDSNYMTSSRFCDAARVQNWLQDQVANKIARPVSDDSSLNIFSHFPGVEDIEYVEGEDFSVALQASFEASKGPEYRKGKTKIIRPVGQVYYVERSGRKKPRWCLRDLECIKEYGNEVFCHERAHATLGGVDVVYRLGDDYCVQMDECGTFGPYSSLKESLLAEDTSDILIVNSASSSISCSELSAEEIAALLQPDEPFREETIEEFGLTINGDLWVCVEPGVLLRAKSDSGE